MPSSSTAFVSALPLLSRTNLTPPLSPLSPHTSSLSSCALTPKASASPQNPPPPISPLDTLAIFAHNIRLSSFKTAPEDEDMPRGDVAPPDFFGDTPFFINLHRAFLQVGPIYQLNFGPKLFAIVQDPPAIRSILRENPILYDKGVLAEVLDEIMGKGLIPADYQTWKLRRRAIAPAFHAKWLSFMTSMFSRVSLSLCDKLAASDVVRDMESEFCSLALDVVGVAVFNYDFGSVASESPVIKAVYRILKEVEHRSTSFIPYWKIPGAPSLVPRLRRFYADMKLLNDTLDTLIRSARESATSVDLDDLQQRNYQNVSDPSLLRFLVELRAEQTTNKQLRDDLITLLIAGHETVAAVLTWTFYEMARNPDISARVRDEVDAVLGDRLPTYEDVQKMPFLRCVIAEGLRLYPAPPVLIRRLLEDTVLPKGSSPKPTRVRRGTDFFINVYSLHRSPDLWEEPDRFDPDRWLRPTRNPKVEGWEGYTPAPGFEQGTPLYPTELNADFAFLPFGGGQRKCVGDSFAMLEATVALAVIIRRFDFRLDDPSKPVGMTTGATIHTKDGLQMRLVPRDKTAMNLEKRDGEVSLTS